MGVKLADGVDLDVEAICREELLVDVILVIGSD
jgi:hypothetical protein